MINSRTDRNLLKWQRGPVPSSSLVPFCHKSKSYDKPRYTFIIANGSRNSSYRRITSRRHAGSYSVSNRAVAEAAVHPLDKQILIRRLLCARSNFKAGLLARSPGQIRRKVDPPFNVALKECFLKHFRRILYVLENTASSMIDSARACSGVPFLRSNSALKCFRSTQ